MRQIILDTETTGLKVEENHRLIEIGCLEMINRKLTGKHFHYYINPERSIEESAALIHGLTNQFLADKPLFADIASELMEFMKGAELIIHNAPFDIGFINAELKALKQSWKPITHYCRVVDTLVLARQLHVGQRNSLDALCKRYRIDNSKREFHGALLDASLLAEVYLAMTGGQGSLFGDDLCRMDGLTKEVIAVEQEKVNIKRNLVVYTANEDEKKSHIEYLRKMAEKGKCVWE